MEVLSCVNMATNSSSEEGLASSVSNLMYGGGRSIFSMTMGGDFLSMSFSDIDDLLPDLWDDGTPDLFFLQMKTQAARMASAAPRKRQPIAMPTVSPRESPGLSFDEGEFVWKRLGDVCVAAMVGEEKLLSVEACDDKVTLGNVALDCTTGSERDEVAVPWLVVAGTVEDCSGETLCGGDVTMESVPTSAPWVTISVGVGTVGDVRFASSWMTTDEIWLSARTHGSENLHSGVYVTLVEVDVVEAEPAILLSWMMCVKA
jgi:hypothetical protein